MGEPLVIIDNSQMLTVVEGNPLDPYRLTRLRIIDNEPIRKTIGPRTTTLSGTVVDEGLSPVSRAIRVWKGGDFVVTPELTFSDENGDFSHVVYGNHHDEFYVMVLGEEGEDSPMISKIKGKVQT